VHIADIDVCIAGYLAHGTNHTGAVEVVAEQEISAGGYDIDPVFADTHNVGLTA
jgi:hypothetical protein